MKRLGQSRRRLVFGLIWAVGGVLISLSGLSIYRFTARHHNQPYVTGVSFSTKYARELDLDWREAYLALLNDLHVRQFRLMTYWDEGEPRSGDYHFEDLDFQMEQAAKVGSKISLAIGLRQPRYPECFVPDWAVKLSEAERQTALERYLKAVVERYRLNSAIVSWQLENEALNTAFGVCRNFDRARLTSEFKLVKALDPGRPIMMSVSNEYGLPLGQPRGDIVGFAIYHTVFEGRVIHRYFTYPFTPLFFRLRAALIEDLIKRPVAVHELQGEPWGSTATKDLSLAEQNKSMDAKTLNYIVNFARDSGIRTMDLWGGEWWYWRKVKFNDSSLWETARAFYK